jgi:REP element-mobilizing transposase RayT
MARTNMTAFNPDIHHRRSIRLKDYDYSQPGAYFVTIAVYQRFPLFGEINGQTMFLNQYGEIAHIDWTNIPSRYSNVFLDSFIVMPNHVHGIINITESDTVGAGLKPALIKRYPLHEIVRSFKSYSARQINNIRKTPGLPIWQRNYYEHVIRDEIELNQIREYICNNAIKWSIDIENPDKQKGQV